MPSTITYRDDWHTDTTIAIGQDYSIKREGACLDLHLHRALSVDCPLTLTILIRTDGSIAQWAAEFDGARGSNTYWHFASGPHHPITAEQLKTLAGIHFGTIMPYGVKGCLGAPVCAAAFDGKTSAEIEALGGVTPGSIAYNG